MSAEQEQIERVLMSRWRVDWLSKGGLTAQTEYDLTHDDALRMASSLRISGLANVVAWEDPAVYEARVEGAA